MPNVRIIPSKINPLTKLPNESLQKRRVAAYARVSTEQEEQANSYEAQVDYYTNYINNHPEWQMVDIYTDKGISGTNLKYRDGFNKMIKDARNGLIDLIITKSVSRFARNTLDTISLTRELKSKGVEIFFEEQNVYTFDSNGELMLTILASMAQEESRNISENVKWGKKKKAVDGYSQLGYSNFLGYDKHPTDKLKGFIVNEEQAKVVRYIYNEFLKGKSVATICKDLTDKGIETPAHKVKWHPSTIVSILKNEKYKGDAEMQKTFVKNFLDHVSYKNKGELEKIYVDNHHDPIIDKNQWAMVQVELQRRENNRYCENNPFKCKLICGDCGGIYGSKIFHSNDRYRKVVLVCNDKYKKKGDFCKTPNLTEEDVKARFIKAYNNFMGDRTQLIEDCNEMIEVLDNSKELEDKITTLSSKAADIIVLVENLIKQNTAEAMDQVEFKKKYDAYDKEHAKILSDIDNAKKQLEKKRLQADYMRAFIAELDSKPNLLEEFDINIWSYLIEKAVVNQDGSITFIFNNGKEIKIAG